VEKRRRRHRREVHGAELHLLANLALAAQGARVVVDDLRLSARQLGELVDELLGRLRRAVLGRTDVAHHQLFGLGEGDGGPREHEGGEGEQSESSHRAASFGWVFEDDRPWPPPCQ